ncbi:MAG TPA: catalase family protein [Longimicrobiaceae bacterium]|nr:catalase family protein [Longimicrobiaceae bacterium]
MSYAKRAVLLWLGVLAMVSAAAGCRRFSGPVPALGEETIPPGEDVAIAQTTAIIAEQLAKAYPDSIRPMRRDAHAKAHGCVKARFTVLDSIPGEFRYGVFTPGAGYDAWVRYSNGNELLRADSINDARGMAIKLMGVPGEKLLESERDAQTQDFVLINHPAFFIKNAIQYVGFQQASALGHSLEYFLNLRHPLESHPRELRNALELTNQVVGNPLAIQYWSMVPYRLGPDSQAVKYSARPCTPIPNVRPADPDPDYLQEAMVATLSAGSACFDFMVQLQTNARTMPIEDATVTWDTAHSPFRVVARLVIPRQQFDSADQMSFCDNLSFTPWHALPVHRPLGGINRARKVVYQAISEMRHRANGVPRREPTSFAIIPDI